MRYCKTYDFPIKLLEHDIGSLCRASPVVEGEKDCFTARMSTPVMSVR